MKVNSKMNNISEVFIRTKTQSSGNRQLRNSESTVPKIVGGD